jgi:hypothetical protein
MLPKCQAFSTAMTRHTRRQQHTSTVLLFPMTTNGLGCTAWLATDDVLQRINS